MSQPHVVPEVASVFRTGNRRFFTKHAAYVYKARRMIREKARRQCGEQDDPCMGCGECQVFFDHGKPKETLERLVRFLKREYER